MGRGLLLINLGTPSSDNLVAVKAYLRQFLRDKRIIELPIFFRYLLIELFILPFRAKKSLAAYQSIWTDQGSPLLFHSLNLTNKLQEALKTKYTVVLGMRYGEPSLESAIAALQQCESITVLPLFPQYSSAASGSAIEEALRIITNSPVIPSLKVIRDFYQFPAYIKAQAALIKPFLKADHYLLFSYHGIPERQLQRSGCKQSCTTKCPIHYNAQCYKSQCYQTSFLLAQELDLNCEQYTTAFQSRLGKIPWIKPYTEEVLIELATKGIQNLIVISPSFVADCLETLEEVNIRIRKQWLALGGKTFTLIPSLNDNPLWVEAIMALLSRVDKA